MTDGFQPLSIERLARWISKELRQRESIFGIGRALFVGPEQTIGLQTRRFGQLLETPLGVAAGPHTQLAENIVSAWLCGARFMELKTVQRLDTIEVSRPCIDMEDEGYNCEWSQELTIRQSLEQYVGAWVLIHLFDSALAPWKGSPGRNGPGTIFNMSIGYDLEGIRSANMQSFISSMRDADGLIDRMLGSVREVMPFAADIAVPRQVSDNVTLSTMHGCPPEEIESIARYLIEELGLNTVVKLNPTLLGKERVRELLNSELGYEIEVPDVAFAHDPEYEDALPMVRRLKEAADAAGLFFGVKLSNTLETVNRRGVLGEETAYLSGRALYPITLALAARLAGDSDIDVSYAGGADHSSFPDLCAAGVWPVTVCSDLLRPGGYGRLRQYIQVLEEATGGAPFVEFSAKAEAGAADAGRLESMGRAAARSGRYAKSYYRNRSTKNDRELPRLDCVAAPCMLACPVEQKIPRYIRAVAQGDPDGALEIIRTDNPVASTCAMICDHECESACTRLNYDEAVAIRDLKRWAVERGREPAARPHSRIELSVAVVGGGPAGIACARSLAEAGAEVSLFERSSQGGGLADRLIPGYRLSRPDIRKDLDSLRTLGVRLELDQEVDIDRMRAMLDAGFDYLFYAGGAPLDRKMEIPGEQLPGVVGALEFLERLKTEGVPAGGSTGRTRRVLVVGGGNSAMDAARSARRLAGPNGSVRLLYRRTVKEMPADREELAAVIEEGVEIIELIQPIGVRSVAGGLSLEFVRTRLGGADDSGRARPLPISGSEGHLEADLVVSAVGQRRDSIGEALHELSEQFDGRLYLGGDAARGPASVVLAASDGKRAAAEILRASGVAVGASGAVTPESAPKDWDERIARLAPRRKPPILPLEERGLEERVIGRLSDGDAVWEAERCLECDLRCDLCVTVCPNRANLALPTQPARYPVYTLRRGPGGVEVTEQRELELRQSSQVVNIADLCNECGNCATFCPSSGDPYRTKPRFVLDAQILETEEDAYFLPGGGVEAIEHVAGGKRSRFELVGQRAVWTLSGLRVIFDAETLEIIEAVGTEEGLEAGRADSSEEAVTMAILLKAARDSPLL